jgi:hypothetical protein
VLPIKTMHSAANAALVVFMASAPDVIDANQGTRIAATRLLSTPLHAMPAPQNNADRVPGRSGFSAHLLALHDAVIA